MEKETITESKINRIAAESSARDRALFTVLRQSGLKPNVIAQLRVKHFEAIREANTPIPCKIDVPKEIEKSDIGRHPSFIGEEAVKHLKRYLTTQRELQNKEKLTPESLAFIVHKKPDKKVAVKELNRTFKEAAGGIDINALREFFRKKSKDIEANHLNYLMGDRIHRSYTPESDEFYRKLYTELALPSLEIEPPITRIMKQLIKRLREIDNVLFPKPIPQPTDWMAEADRIAKWVQEHPEEVERDEEWERYRIAEFKQYMEIMKENPEGLVSYLQDLEEKLEVLKIMLRQCKGLI